MRKPLKSLWTSQSRQSGFSSESLIRVLINRLSSLNPLYQAHGYEAWVPSCVQATSGACSTVISIQSLFLKYAKNRERNEGSASGATLALSVPCIPFLFCFHFLYIFSFLVLVFRTMFLFLVTSKILACHSENKEP